MHAVVWVIARHVQMLLWFCSDHCVKQDDRLDQSSQRSDLVKRYQNGACSDMLSKNKIEGEGES